jgi:hypothetical protein
VKKDEALALAKELRAQGVSRVEFVGDDVTALEFGAEPPTDEEQATTPEASAAAMPFEAAVAQMQRGSFKS